MGITFETKTSAGMKNVAHATQVAGSAGLGVVGKLEYTRDVAGKPLAISLLGTEQSILKGPSKFAGVVVAAKVNTTSATTITAKYSLDTKVPVLIGKLNTTVGNRKLSSELTWTKDSDFRTETEYTLDSATKFQVESVGSKLSAVKATRARGKSQLKLKYCFLSESPVVGLDTFLDGRKWDFEYHVKSEKLDAKVKLYPLTLAASANVGKANGLGKGGVTYKLTHERTLSF